MVTRRQAHYDNWNRLHPNDPIGQPAPTTGGGSGGAGGGGSTNPPAGAAPGSGTDQHPTDLTLAQQDGWAYLNAILREYGLESLSSWAKDQIIEGNSPDMIAQLLYERKEFKDRFGAIFDRREAGLPAISVNEYLAYERQARQMMVQAGLPAGFYDSPEDFRKFLANDRSLAELSEEVQLARVAVYESSPEVRSELGRLYGIGEGDLVAHFLDPNAALPILQRKMLAAQTAAASDLTGFGALTRDEAERLGLVGTTVSEAMQGFGRLTQQRELYDVLPGEVGQQITREQQLASEFENDIGAQQAVDQRRRMRIGEFATGGGFATDKTGFAGLASAGS